MSIKINFHTLFSLIVIVIIALFLGYCIQFPFETCMRLHYLGIPAEPTHFIDGTEIIYQLQTTTSGLAHKPNTGFNIYHLLSLIPLFNITYANWYAVILNSFFITFIILLFRPKSFFELIVSLLVVLSPSILFEIERANIESIVLLLISTGFILLRNQTNNTRILIAIILILFASALKFFPIVVLAVIPLSLNKKLKGILVSIISFLIFIGYLILNKETILGQWSDPSIRFTGVSFGRNILGDFFVYRTSLPITIIITICTIACLLLACLKGLFRSTNTDAPLSINQLLYYTGAMIYLASYFIGNSCDYRLIFLLLLVPKLLEKITKPFKVTVNSITLAAIIMSLWSNFFHIQLNLAMYTLPAQRMIYLPNLYYIWIDEGVNLLLFVILSFTTIPILTNKIISDLKLSTSLNKVVV